MKLGADPKKAAVLGILLVVAGIVYWNNRLDSGGPSSHQQAAPAAVAVQSQRTPDMLKAPAPDLAKPTAPTRTRAQREAAQEFRPSLKSKRPEDRPDPTTIDPTLQLGLLARLKNVRLDGGSIRSLFDFSAAPVDKAPNPGNIKVGPKTNVATTVTPPLVATTPVEPPKPTAPPIPLKFYGFIANPRLGTKRGFFLEGEEIHVASEGDTVKKRYKVVRIGINSVVMEDTEFKSQQTLPLEEPPQTS